MFFNHAYSKVEKTSEQKEGESGPINGVRNFLIHKLSAKCPGTTGFRRNEQSWPLRPNQQEEIILQQEKKLITKNIPGGGGGVHGKFIVIEPEKLSFFSAFASRPNSHLLRKKFSHKLLCLRMSEANWFKPMGVYASEN